MKFVSLVTRIGLLAMAMILISVLSAEEVWADSSDQQPTTNGLADSLLNDWALPLLFVGILMAASMIAYLSAQFLDVKLFHFWKNFSN